VTLVERLSDGDRPVILGDRLVEEAHAQRLLAALTACPRALFAGASDVAAIDASFPSLPSPVPVALPIAWSRTALAALADLSFASKTCEALLLEIAARGRERGYRGFVVGVPQTAALPGPPAVCGAPCGMTPWSAAYHIAVGGGQLNFIATATGKGREPVRRGHRPGWSRRVTVGGSRGPVGTVLLRIEGLRSASE